ncbi:diguanylate cyclase [Thermodesulfobacterium sp. TA1]|uniref:sensor domain-containing diguanylate cyclase n=1 Tax=Thermodesulfobacterium sp. TA1 TaxID=2234087 RepID=UPI001232A725|nr:diguanylate cyclase [Thermodesulfobacterium sp. TA1]QER42407.1 diguanylate cyclase [Thermodesulfobacterium sp. TA1]
MKKLLFYKSYGVILGLIFWGWILGIGVLYNNFSSQKQTILENNLNDRIVMYNSTINSIKRLTQLYVTGIVASQSIQNLFKSYKGDEEVLRNRLYQFLLPFIQKFPDLGLDLHFHTSDGRSLLRIYNPSVYGDDLTREREDLRYVMKHKRPVFGFASGKVLSGFRYTVPLMDEKEEYLGSADFVVSVGHFERLVKELSPDLCCRFIFKKKETVDKLLEPYKKQFSLSFLGEDWVEYQASSKNEIFYKDILKKLSQEPAFKKALYLEKNQVFEFRPKKGEVYEVVLIPITDFKGDTVGFLLNIRQAKELEALYKDFYKNFWGYTFLLILILLVSFYTNKKAREVFLERKRLNVVLNFMEISVYTVKDFKITLVNPKLLKLLGYSEKELIGKRDHEVFVELLEHKCLICEAIAKGEDWEGDLVLKRKDGSYLIANVKVSQVKDESGKVIESIVCFWDITLRKKLEDALYLESITDPLTKLFNRRFVSTVLESLKQKAEETKQPFSVIMIDIDNFKRVNDIYGHDVGDEVLKALAETFKNNLREQDVVGRWGGEEFIVVLPETDLKNAVMVAEKLRTAVEELEIGVNKIKVTISLGVSEYLLTEEVSELIKRADSALYLAKRSGKNCVKIET